MTYLAALLILCPAFAMAETQTIHCSAPEADTFSIAIKDPLDTVNLDNDCTDSKNHSCVQLRKLVKSEDYPTAMEFGPISNGNYHVLMHAEENMKVDLIIPGEALGKAGHFTSKSEICIQDCIKPNFKCTSTIK